MLINPFEISRRFFVYSTECSNMFYFNLGLLGKIALNIQGLLCIILIYVKSTHYVCRYNKKIKIYKLLMKVLLIDLKNSTLIENIK